ncbi:S1C family serine protease [Halococcus agarilyticus]|uniref:S1C family serine protease n=1 Tax=Halococcus agarilyticus TaxID=1232219 RepID=UPI000677C337|nr:trypsin-like peptidase domain-containing protein [Halococcus agarilyticus]
MDDARTTRRAYLGVLGTVLAAGIAGCGDALGDGTTANTTPAATATDGSTPAEITTDGTATAATADSTTPAEAATVADGNASAGDAPSPYTRVYRETVGSVVLVQVTGGMGQGGQGSGFVLRGNYVVTNAHVVSNATEAQIRFSQGEWRSGSVVGTDPSADLAVIEVENPPDYATPLSLVDEQPAIGTEVVAIGNPYGRFEGSLTSGLVSGVNRSIPAPSGYTIPDAIQTSAPVNPGNSGGPLVNLAGDVVGVINSGGGENLAFAISAALVDRVVPSLIANGEYEHAYMGVRLRTVTPPVAEQRALDRSRGVLVTDVPAGGPSDGVLRPGDVIVALGGQRIDSLQGLSSYLALQASPGDTIDVAVRRDGERRTLSLTLGTRPEQPGPVQPTTTG